MKNAASRFSAMSAARSSVLDKAREASRLTIPGLIPQPGQNEHFTPVQPYQSVGAHGVRTLGSRLLSTLFPTSVPFFRLELDAFAAASVEADKAKTDSLLSQVSESTASLMEDLRVRPAMAEAMRHLIVAGNIVIHFPLDRAPKLYRLDQFVLKRNAEGDWVEIIIQEKVYPSTLPEAVRNQLGINIDTDKSEQQIDIYTVVTRSGDTVEEHQEIDGKVIESTKGASPANRSGWLAPRWLAVPGSDYGRSLITEYLGDLLSLEDLNRSIVQFAAVASRIINLVDPNSTLDVAELAAAESGDYLYGREADVSSLALNKSQDFGVMSAVAERIEDRVSRAFLIQSFRQAERVTAEEIRAQSEELETVLGGTFSVLASELQEPIASRYLYIAERRNLIPPIPAGIKPKVITGLAALGRAAEVNRLRTFIGDASAMLSNPAVVENFNVSALLTRLGVEHGVLGLGDLLKSDEQKAEEQQQAMMAQATQAAAPGFMDAAMKAASDNPDQGTE